MIDVMDTMSPMVGRVNAYFAPVNRIAQQATIFDAAQNGAFALNSPPAPWIGLGWIVSFKRTCGTKIEAVRMGAPAVTQIQARTEIEATVTFAFESWGKLQLALSAGTQQMNLLKAVSGTTQQGSGGTAIAAIVLQPGSTASVLQLGTTAANGFTVGELIAVDVDYVTQTGFVGSGVSGGYVQAALTDVDYVRRVTLNVARVTAVNATTGALSLQWPLIAGIPIAAMKVSRVSGFCDREGSNFFQEWSAVFVGEGQQGERVIWHYPRLQAMTGATEAIAATGDSFDRVQLAAAFRALPVKDPVDGETVVCFRSYLAA